MVQALADLLPTLTAWTDITTDPDAVNVGAWPNPDHLPAGPAALVRPPLLTCQLHARESRRWLGTVGLELLLPVPSSSDLGGEALSCLAAVASLRDSMALADLHPFAVISSIEVSSFEPGEWASLTQGPDDEEQTVTRQAGYKALLSVSVQSLGL